jgi:hypothetical protein
MITLHIDRPNDHSRIREHREDSLGAGGRECCQITRIVGHVLRDYGILRPDCYTVESFVARKPRKRRSDRSCPCDCPNLGVGDLIEPYPPIVAGPPNQFRRFLPHCVTFAADMVYKPRQALKGVLLHACMLPESGTGARRPPDHATFSRMRRPIDLETHEAVFTWLLGTSWHPDSFRAKRLDRINRSGPQRRNIAGDHRCADQTGADNDVGQRIGRLDVEEQCR